MPSETWLGEYLTDFCEKVVLWQNVIKKAVGVANRLVAIIVGAAHRLEGCH
jgi:hypothetical protein